MHRSLPLSVRAEIRTSYHIKEDILERENVTPRLLRDLELRRKVSGGLAKSDGDGFQDFGAVKPTTPERRAG